VQRARRDREVFQEDARKLLGEVGPGQKETSRLLRDHLGEREMKSG
jgi:hypothetical protein